MSTSSPNETDALPPWGTAYLECMSEASASLNVSSDPNIWLSILFTPHNTSIESTTSPTPPGELYDPGEPFFWGGHNTTFPTDEDQVLAMVAGHCLSKVHPHQRPYLLPWWQQGLWTIAFGLMLCAAIGGNALVMWIVCAHKRMRTVTNYFLMNLSAADLLMSVLNCIFNFIYMLHSDWPFGAAYCAFSNTVANVTIAASVFTLMAISFDRYIAIVRPLEPRMSKTLARVFIVAIWVSSCVLAAPCAVFSITVTATYMDDEVRRGCILQWPDGHTSASQQEHIYNIVFFITTYLMPMLVMFTSYSLISVELWGSRHIGELTERQVNVIRSKRRVVRMFIVIVVIFALCWLPQQAFFLYQYHDRQVLNTDHVQHIYLAFYWLAMSNAMVNPIVYYWMNARFRAYFREVILQCLCLGCARSHRPQYTASPVLQRRVPSLDRDASSRSRSGLRLSNKGGAQCDICLQSLQPNPLNPNQKPPMVGNRHVILTTTLSQPKHDDTAPNMALNMAPNMALNMAPNMAPNMAHNMAPSDLRETPNDGDNISSRSLYHERDLGDRGALLAAAPHSDEGRWPGSGHPMNNTSSCGGHGDPKDSLVLSTFPQQAAGRHEDGTNHQAPGEEGKSAL